MIDVHNILNEYAIDNDILRDNTGTCAVNDV